MSDVLHPKVAKKLEKIGKRVGLDLLPKPQLDIKIENDNTVTVKGVNEKKLVAKVYHDAIKKIRNAEQTHFVFKGGRGSGKSSFCAIQCILWLLINPKHDVVALRKVGETLRNSVFTTLQWAIGALGLADYFRFNLTNMKITYTPTGQYILLLGVDDDGKRKSIKSESGRFGLVWFEELVDFKNPEEILSLWLSFMRGNKEIVFSDDLELEKDSEQDKIVVLYSYNPPYNLHHWVNNHFIDNPRYYYQHSTYLDIPPKWVGNQFLAEIEDIKRLNERAYRHEILGELISRGLEIFTNIETVKMSDADIASYGQNGGYLVQGLDFGFTNPIALVQGWYDKANMNLYVFGEIYGVGMTLITLSQKIEALNKQKPAMKSHYIIADSAEPRSIDTLFNDGIYNITKAQKGPGSIEEGLRFLSLTCAKIFIDPERCPNTYRELSQYAYEQDSKGVIDYRIPDKNNHAIDALRYAVSYITAIK